MIVDPQGINGNLDRSVRPPGEIAGEGTDGEIFLCPFTISSVKVVLPIKVNRRGRRCLSKKIGQQGAQQTAGEGGT